MMTRIERRMLLWKTARGVALLGALAGVSACRGDEIEDEADEAIEELRDDAMDAQEEAEDEVDDRT